MAGVRPAICMIPVPSRIRSVVAAIHLYRGDDEAEDAMVKAADAGAELGELARAMEPLDAAERPAVALAPAQD